jgi:BirA family biotin operon repressor/biotin-[acetyl-CoA-carboxylase] ligase
VAGLTGHPAGRLKPVPATLHLLDSVPSTQDRLHELAGQGVPAGTAVLAAEQTEGRGRRGRHWASPRGGLWLSVLCRPAAALATELLSLRVALAVARVIEARVATVAVRLKWPNDLMLDDRKLGGILCEARWQGDRPAWVAVGIGLNLRNPIPRELADQAVSLAGYAPEVTPENLAPDLVTAVLAAGEPDRALSPAELTSFVERDWLRGRRIREPEAGTAEGISAEGLLAVRRDDGTLALVRSGTVVLA